MAIYMTGIDHNKADVDMRSVFSITKSEAEQLIQDIKNINGIKGCVIISTCNRMELWLSTTRDWSGSPFDILCDYHGVSTDDYEEFFYNKREYDAVDHLLKLTSGLLSRIIGEDQIITQVRNAVEQSRKVDGMDSVLEELFRIAITAGKKIKTEIVFSHANGSAMNSAVRMLQSRGLDFNDLKCMVIGNGDMGKLAAETLEKAGADVTVTVRQYRSGVVNIPKNCKRIDYGQRMDLLPDCDVVVSATSSPNYTLTMDHLEGVPTDHNVILIDLAVPRDIEPGVDQLENYELYDIDDFSESEISTENMNAMQEAESIFNSEKIVFRDWYESRDLIPLIQKVRDDATYDMDYRMQKILKEIPIEGEELDHLEDYVKSATGKVMTKLLFGIRDRLDSNVFAECINSMVDVYEKK